MMKIIILSFTFLIVSIISLISTNQSFAACGMVDQYFNCSSAVGPDCACGPPDNQGKVYCVSWEYFGPDPVYCSTPQAPNKLRITDYSCDMETPFCDGGDPPPPYDPGAITINPNNVMSLSDDDRYDVWSGPHTVSTQCWPEVTCGGEIDIGPPYASSRMCLGEELCDCGGGAEDIGCSGGGWDYGSSYDKSVNPLHRICASAKSDNAICDAAPHCGGSWTEDGCDQCPDPHGIISSFTVEPSQSISFTIYTNIATDTSTSILGETRRLHDTTGGAATRIVNLNGTPDNSNGNQYLHNCTFSQDANHRLVYTCAAPNTPGSYSATFTTKKNCDVNFSYQVVLPPTATPTPTHTPTPTPIPALAECGGTATVPPNGSVYRGSTVTATSVNYSTDVGYYVSTRWQACDNGGNNCSVVNPVCDGGSCSVTIPALQPLYDVFVAKTNVQWLPTQSICIPGSEWTNTTPPPGSSCTNACLANVLVSCNAGVWGNFPDCNESCTQTRINECGGTDTRDCTGGTCPLPTATPTVPTPTITPGGPTVPPTATPIPPTATPIPPTNTPVPPTATPIPPTNTPVPPPTATPIPPTNTPTPTPTTPAGEPSFEGELFYDFNQNGVYNTGCAAGQISEKIDSANFGCTGNLCNDCSPRTNLESLIGPLPESLEGFRLNATTTGGTGVVYGENPKYRVRSGTNSGYYFFAVQHNNSYRLTTTDPQSALRSCSITTTNPRSIFVGTSNSSDINVGIHCSVSPTTTPVPDTPTPTTSPTATPVPGTPTPTLSPTPFPVVTPWWQARGGTIFAKGDMTSALPTPVPPEYLIDYSRNNLVGSSAGVPMCVGTLSASNYYSVNSSNNPHITNDARVSQDICAEYSYDYFKKQFSAVPVDTLAGTISDQGVLTDNATPLLGAKVKVISGNVDLAPATTWNFPNDPNEKYIFLIDGDLTISQGLPMASPQLINVEEGGFVAFIVSGDIIIDGTVGNSSPNNSYPSNLEGMFIGGSGSTTNKGIVIQHTSDPIMAPEKQFVGEGNFIGCDRVQLNRNLPVGLNVTYPAELFVNRPDFVSSIPNALKRAAIIWQEE